MVETGHYLTYHMTDIIPLFHTCNKHNKCEMFNKSRFTFKILFSPAHSCKTDRNLVHEYIKKMQVPHRHKSVTVRCRVIPKIIVAIKNIYIPLKTYGWFTRVLYVDNKDKGANLTKTFLPPFGMPIICLSRRKRGGGGADSDAYASVGSPIRVLELITLTP